VENCHGRKQHAGKKTSEETIETKCTLFPKKAPTSNLAHLDPLVHRAVWGEGNALSSGSAKIQKVSRKIGKAQSLVIHNRNSPILNNNIPKK